MNKAIQCAIEGGYEPFRTVKMSESTCELHGEHYGCNFKDAKVKGICGANINRFLLDPLFWQSLGKQQGWANNENVKIWKYNWHSFIDHIADGGDIDSFFNNLLV